MSPEKKNLLAPLTSALRSLPLLTLSLLALPFLAPPLVEALISPLLPLIRPTVSGEDPRGQSLHQQLAKARQETTNLRNLLKDLGRLEKDNSLEGGILARNLGQSPRLIQHGLILDRGLQDGVTMNAVVAHTGTLIGIVDELRDDWCHVRLVSAPNFSISVDVIGHQERNSPVEGWARGICGGPSEQHSLINVQYIPEARRNDCFIGDYVVTSGNDFKAPAGLLVGRVTDIETMEKDLFLHITVISEKNLNPPPLMAIYPPPPNPFKKNEQAP